MTSIGAHAPIRVGRVFMGAVHGLDRVLCFQAHSPSAGALFHKWPLWWNQLEWILLFATKIFTDNRGPQGRDGISFISISLHHLYINYYLEALHRTPSTCHIEFKQEYWFKRYWKCSIMLSKWKHGRWSQIAKWLVSQITFLSVIIKKVFVLQVFWLESHTGIWLPIVILNVPLEHGWCCLC